MENTPRKINVEDIANYIGREIEKIRASGHLDKDSQSFGELREKTLEIGRLNGLLEIWEIIENDSF